MRTGRPNRGAFGGDKIPKDYRLGQLNQFTPEQQQLFQQNFGYLGQDSDLARLAGGDEEAFQEMEAPAYRDFNSLLAGTASRFGAASGGGQGQLGGRAGSGYNNALTSASSNFAQDLQSRREGLKRQALNDLMGYSNQILGQRPTDRFLVEKQQKERSPWWGLAEAGIGAAGSYARGGR